VAGLHCRGAYGLSGNAVLPITAELPQLRTKLDLRHGGGLLLPPQLAIDKASTSSISAVAWRRFIDIQLADRRSTDKWRTETVSEPESQGTGPQTFGEAGGDQIPTFTFGDRE
jgi:hypothetical protein